MSRALTSLVAAACVAAPATASAADPTDQILVRHRVAASAAERADVRADAGVRLDERLALTGVELVETAPATSRADALAALRDDPDVLWAEPNREVRVATNDAFWGYQYALENLGGSGRLFDADVDIPEAWSVTRGSGVTVGVVDTGVRSSHPDLAGQLVAGTSYASDGVPSAEDDNGHGTHVAGIIAARSGNGVGVSGAAPEAKVKAFRALGADGRGTTSAVASAFQAAGDQGLRVVNASLGAPTASYAERQAILTHPNTLYVVAAGNDAIDVDTGTSTSYPCRYTLANVLCVGASTATDIAAGFSNRGQTSVDLFAPGDEIASTYYDPDTATNGYGAMSGTSMASPLVAAAAALVAAEHPTWSAAQLKAALLDSVDHPAGLAGVSATGGRLNAARALGVDVGGDGQAPGAPTSVTAIGSFGRVDLSWTSSPAADVAGYRVWRLVGGDWTVVAAPVSTQAALTGLTAGESLTLRVTARDRSGEESAASASITVVADADEPVIPPPAEGTSDGPDEPGTDTGGGGGAGAGSGWTTPAAPTAGGGTSTAPSTTPSPGTAPTAPPAVAERFITNLRTTKTRGRVRAVRFHLSVPATVTLVATRPKGKGRAAITRRRTLELPAGSQSVSVDRTLRGLGLPAGSWRLTITAGATTRTIAFRLP